MQRVCHVVGSCVNCESTADFISVQTKNSVTYVLRTYTRTIIMYAKHKLQNSSYTYYNYYYVYYYSTRNALCAMRSATRGVRTEMKSAVYTTRSLTLL